MRSKIIIRITRFKISYIVPVTVFLFIKKLNFFMGIGENGHLAFNDPGVADFNDPMDVKIVDLDQECKQQQVAEGWFPNLASVPKQAITLTIPALLRAPKLIASVPGSRKANIVRRTLQEEISTVCPATILRHHPNATVFLDDESASQLNANGFGV